MKNIRFYIILSSLALALSFQISYAQGYNNERKSLPPRDVTVYLEVVPSSPRATGSGADTLNIPDQLFNTKVIIELFSIANVKKLHVKLGTNEGLADVAEQTFTFDDKKNLRAPFSYEREGKTIILNMGQVRGFKNYQAEVVMEDETGKKSEPKGSRRNN